MRNLRLFLRRIGLPVLALGCGMAIASAQDCDPNMTVTVNNLSPYDTITLSITDGTTTFVDSATVSPNSSGSWTFPANAGVQYTLSGYPDYYYYVDAFNIPFTGTLDSVVYTVGDPKQDPTFVVSGSPLCPLYPYWDAASPGYDAQGYPICTIMDRPFVASSNAVFGIHAPWTCSGPARIARWTECGGWEDLPGLEVLRWSFGNVLAASAHAQRMMTVHDHYLYAVGFFQVDGYNGPFNYADLATTPLQDPPGQWLAYKNAVQIARFDFCTGTWTPLGQNFTATNVFYPTTIAVDSQDRIYVGFRTEAEILSDLTGTQLTIDMLDVSTNGGASWQRVGEGLKAYPPYVVHDWPQPGQTSSYVRAGISALYADGTNVYIGGDFSGSGGTMSSNVIMRAGNAWRAFGGGSGVGPATGYNLWYDWNFDTVNDIVSIGTNVYVAGIFDSPNLGLARFSSVNGAVLPTGDPGSLLGWSDGCCCFLTTGGATSLAVNNGNLYLGGKDPCDSSHPPLARLSDPQAANPAGWTTTFSAYPSDLGLDYVHYTWSLAAEPNGNAVYVESGAFTGQDHFGHSSDGFSRLVTGPDGPSPTASITHISRVNGVCTLYISGTAGSHWQILGSNDGSAWSPVGALTIWSCSVPGTATFTDASGFAAYKLSNNCGQSGAASSGELINVQFGTDQGPSYIKTGYEGGVGFSSTDYWNFGTGAALDFLGLPTSVQIGGDFDSQSLQNPYNSDHLYNGFAFSGSGADFQINLWLGPGTYDIYAYNGTQYLTTFSVIWDGMVLDSQTGSTAAFTVSIPYPSTGWVTVNCSSGLEPICNGLQIQSH